MKQKYRDWWKSKTRGRDLFFATAPTPEGASPLFTAPDVKHIDNAFSAVFLRGQRHYAFKSVEERDDFVSEYAEAQACNDPLTSQPIEWWKTH